MIIFVTGSAGFIGFHLSKTLLEQGDTVIGLDNFNDYYEVSLKEDRNAILEKFKNYHLYRGDLNDIELLAKIFAAHKIDKICHLAGYAGVRHSILHPELYVSSNIAGFVSLLEAAKKAEVKNIVYASSSSVYGGNTKTPFAESDSVDQPVSLYAASKKADEVIAYTYHHLFGFNCTGLRFFTVYGPYGRPDMGPMIFAKGISKGETIKVFNFGKMKRDFTYVADIVAGILSALEKLYPYEIFNLGNDNPTELEDFIKIIEDAFGIEAKKDYQPMQPGDVPITWADLTHATAELSYAPRVGLKEGIGKFIEWYKEYYEV